MGLFTVRLLPYGPCDLRAFQDLIWSQGPRLMSRQGHRGLPPLGVSPWQFCDPLLPSVSLFRNGNICSMPVPHHDVEADNLFPKLINGKNFFFSYSLKASVWSIHSLNHMS